MNQFSHQQGVGLIEVMVAVLLLSVAVLGFSALQLRAISATEESLIRTQALSVVRGLAENMRANPLEMKTYEDAINATDSTTVADSSCRELTDACDSPQIAIKESKAAIKKLAEYGISIAMYTCPGTANFSQIKCIVAAWGDTKAQMDSLADPNVSGSTDNIDAKACANENGIYKSGSTCIIVETY